MSMSIFIKTWVNDIPWLRYSLRSIEKFASGFDEVVVVADSDCRNEEWIKDYATRIEFVEKWENGYIQQQYIKLQADTFINSDMVLFVDSDLVFNTPFTPETFLKDNLPILLKTRYESADIAQIWRPLTEKAVGWSVEWEYMRRMPLCYWRDSLDAFRTVYPDLSFKLKKIRGNRFSEFNALGAFIDRYEGGKYFISDTEQWMPPAIARQFRSWDGLTDANRQEIEEILK